MVDAILEETGSSRCNAANLLQSRPGDFPQPMSTTGFGSLDDDENDENDETGSDVVVWEGEDENNDEDKCPELMLEAMIVQFFICGLSKMVGLPQLQMAADFLIENLES